MYIYTHLDSYPYSHTHVYTHLPQQIHLFSLSHITIPIHPFTPIHIHSFALIPIYPFTLKHPFTYILMHPLLHTRRYTQREPICSFSPCAICVSAPHPPTSTTKSAQDHFRLFAFKSDFKKMRLFRLNLYTILAILCFDQTLGESDYLKNWKEVPLKIRLT